MSELKARLLGQTISEYGCDTKIYLKSEADEVIAEKDAEIAKLKALAKEPFLSNRICRKCGEEGTLLYMPTVEDNHTFWDLYNNIGMDYVVGIQCAHCGEVAFVTKQTHEYEIRKQKHKRCLAMAMYCHNQREIYERDSYDWELEDDAKDTLRNKANIMRKWHNRWLAIAEKFKEAK